MKPAKGKLYCGWCRPNMGCNAKRPKRYATRKSKRVQQLIRPRRFT